MTSAELLLVLALGSLAACSAPPRDTLAPTRADARAAGDIHAVDFSAQRHESACGTRVPGNAVEDDGWSLAVADVVYGDLTGDGSDEAVVVLTCTTGGTAGPRPEMHVFTVRDGSVVRLAKIPGGDEYFGPEAKDVTIEGGKLRVVRSWQAGNATPLEEEVETLRWDGARFVRQAHVPRRRVDGIGDP